MHGYFVSLQLYDAARVIANPYAYAEHRERMVQEKMDKLVETRIRSRKDAAGAKVKVNKALAEKVRKEEERARKKEERRAARKVKALAAEEQGSEEEDGDDEVEDTMDVDVEEEGEGEGAPEQKAGAGKTGLLNDPRFAAVFEDPEFEVDQNTREFALLNPSAVAQRQTRETGRTRRKTAVEEEEDESDKSSSDPLSDSDAGGDGDKKSGSESEDSDDAGSKCTPSSHPTFDMFTCVLTRPFSQSSGKTTSARAWPHAARAAATRLTAHRDASPRCGLCLSRRRTRGPAAGWTGTRHSASAARKWARKAKDVRFPRAATTSLCSAPRMVVWR